MIKIKKETAYSGQLIINYNFLTVAKVLLTLALICAGLAIIAGVIWGAVWLYHVLVPVFCWIGENWLELLLGLLALVLLIYACKSDKSRKVLNGKWGGVLVFLLCFLSVLFFGNLFLKDCRGHEPQPVVTETPEQEPKSEEVIFREAFDDVIVARAYLDNVQQQTSGNVALVGLKYIQGLSVKGMTFDGKTYEEAVKIVADEWRPLVMDNLNPTVKLTKQQLSVVILAAMRMGPTGFKNSAFLEKLNAGNVKDAVKALHLQKAGEQPRKVGQEPQKYFYVLRILWLNKVNITELADYPAMSYLSIPLSKMYDGNGNVLFDAEVENTLKKGNNSTPRQMLKL